MSLAIAQPRQLNQFESTEIPGKFVAGRLDSSPSPDTLLLLPSGISVSGIETWGLLFMARMGITVILVMIFPQIALWLPDLVKWGR